MTYLHVGGMAYTIEKILTKATTLLYISPQSKVCTRNYGPPTIARVPILGISGLPSWESRDKMTFGCRVRGEAQKILLGGRWWLLPSSGCDESCEFVFVRGLFVHQKCFNYTLTNLLFGLCKFMWIIDPLVTCCSPHPKVPTCPFTLEVPRNMPQLLILLSFSLWDLQLSLSRSLGCVIVDEDDHWKP
jgi:hypothetical protein